MSTPRLASRRIGSYVCSQCRLSLRSSRFHAASRLPQREDVLATLEQRGLVNQIAGDRDVLAQLLRKQRIGAYAGIDPTAPSLHLGHLLPLMVLFWLYHNGHHAVSLVGGGTARVGDPSGRLTSRAATATEVHDSNLNSMLAQVEELWGNAIQLGRRRALAGHSEGRKELVNNAQWLDGLNILDFLRTMGSVMRLGTMLSRDTVRNKMEKGDGMSFAEFSYPLLQAWDWWQMYRDRNVLVQVGGGDQYGNIVAGLDAVRHIAQSRPAEESAGWLDTNGRLSMQRTPMGITVPLLTTSSGEKFGKSAGNAVWLDAKLTSPFDLYGFLLSSADEDVERYLKLFTFLPLDEISTVMIQHNADPGRRLAQHLLANEVLELVHGQQEAERTRAQHQSMRNPTLSSLASLSSNRGPAKTASRPSDESVARLRVSSAASASFVNILFESGLVATKSEARRSIAGGKVYVATPESLQQDGTGNLKFVQIRDQADAAPMDFVQQGLLVFRLGKWKARVVEVVDNTGPVEGRAA